jgi:hypothetical protein
MREPKSLVLPLHHRVLGCQSACQRHQAARRGTPCCTSWSRSVDRGRIVRCGAPGSNIQRPLPAAQVETEHARRGAPMYVFFAATTQKGHGLPCAGTQNKPRPLGYLRRLPRAHSAAARAAKKRVAGSGIGLRRIASVTPLALTPSPTIQPWSLIPYAASECQPAGRETY